MDLAGEVSPVGSKRSKSVREPRGFSLGALPVEISSSHLARAGGTALFLCRWTYAAGCTRRDRQARIARHRSLPAESSRERQAPARPVGATRALAVASYRAHSVQLMAFWRRDASGWLSGEGGAVRAETLRRASRPAGLRVCRRGGILMEAQASRSKRMPRKLEGRPSRAAAVHPSSQASSLSSPVASCVSSMDWPS